MSTIRKALLASAFAVTLDGTFAGTSLHGETKEVDLVAACAAATRPMIPVACLTNGSGLEVRHVHADDLKAAKKMDRFTVAFRQTEQPLGGSPNLSVR